MFTYEFALFFLAGGVTSLLAFQFLFPRWYARTFNSLEVATDTEVFFARQGGLAITAQGALLIVAAFVPEIRLVSLVLVGTAKLIFVSYLWATLRRRKGLLVTALVDSVTVVAFAWKLFS